MSTEKSTTEIKKVTIRAVSLFSRTGRIKADRPASAICWPVNPQKKGAEMQFRYSINRVGSKIVLQVRIGKIVFTVEIPP